MEVATNESDPLCEPGETGPTLLQRVGVAIDPDDADARCCLEEAERVSGPSERCVDDDSWPATWEAREEKIDDGAGKDGAVLHERLIS